MRTFIHTHPRTKILLFYALIFPITVNADDIISLPEPFAKYSFEQALPKDDKSQWEGSLENKAEIIKIGKGHVLFTGAENGYMDLGENTGKAFFTGVNDFTLSIDVYSDKDNNLNNLGNFICSFSDTYPVIYGNNQDNVQYIFLGAKSVSYTINNRNYAGQQSAGYSNNIASGTWQNITYVQEGDNGKLYLNGEIIGENNNITIKPAIMAEQFRHNWLGRSCWGADAYLKNAYLDNFQIFHTALSKNQVAILCEGLNEKNTEMRLYKLLSSIDLGNLERLKEDIILPTSIDGFPVTWTSSDPSTITTGGIVTRPSYDEPDKEVTLTATITSEGLSESRTFKATVLHLYTDFASVELDAERLNIPTGYLNNAKWYIPLDSIGEYDSKITWASSDPSYITNKGELLTLSDKESKQVKVTLTATISKGSEERKKNFEATIAYPEDVYDGYLFAYFEGSGDGALQEHLRFGVSANATDWKALNNNNPIIMSDTISQSGGIRDPHILRGEDGHTFYIVATDMYVHRYGWGANPGIVLMKSDNLIDWSHASINLAENYPENFGDAYWVWAPQTIYDPSAGKYMVYFTLKRSTSSDLITYYAYANKDFTAFESEPQILFSAKYGSIDNDIIYKDGLWHLFYKGNTKNENGEEYINGIQQAVCPTLHGEWEEDFIYLDVYAGKTPVEGSGIFKLNDGNGYVLMYDLYTSLRYEYQTSQDLFDFGMVSHSFTKDFNPRHGTVTGITREEAIKLNAKWGGVPEDLLTHVEDTKTTGSPFIWQQGNKICFKSSKTETLRICTPDGRLLTTDQLVPGEIFSIALKPGIYLANGLKIAVQQ